jgi:hypothetical protein
MLGLFHGAPGARRWRQSLTVDAGRPGAGVAVVEDALAAVAPERTFVGFARERSLRDVPTYAVA